MEIYQTNIQKYKTTILALQEASNNLSITRLFVFLFSAIIILILATQGLVALMMVAVVLCVGAFFMLIKRHNEIDDLKRHTNFLKEINENEILKLENKLSGFPTGQSFINPEHSYLSDLDIFGKHSLFQLIDRTTTESGNQLLAEWLSGPATKNVILERQEAVKELTPRLEWRQHFQESGMRFKYKKSDYDKLLGWMVKPVQLLPVKSKYLIAIIPLSILSTWATAYFIYEFFVLGNFESVVPLMIISLVNALVLRGVRSIAEEITENLVQNVKILAGYQSLSIKIESEKFHSGILKQLQSVLRQDNCSAATEIGRLKKIWDVFQVRGRRREFNNFFYAVFNVLWFLDIYLIILTEEWKEKNGAHLKGWAVSVSEFEVLSSLAGFHFSNPSFNFPEIKDEPYNIHFEMLGHPLIRPEKKKECAMASN